MSETDLELLQRYGRDHAEDAFGEIVRRHLDLVYSAALRQVRSPQLAQEVAQSAFTDLASHVHRLAPDTVLTAWLYQVTRHKAIDVVRRETRRQLREQIAVELTAMNATSVDWTDLEPLLDDAMQALEDTDRAAVLLRYFENKSLREVGQALGTSEDAAQKRVSRAVERLRGFFAKHGVAVGASGLGVAISANAVHAAPAGLAAAVSAGATLAAMNLTAASGAGAASAFLGSIWQVLRAKPAAVLVGTALVTVTVFLWITSPERTGQAPGGDGARTAASIAAQNSRADESASADATVANSHRAPDPRALLRGVAQARQRIVSGSIGLEVTTENYWLPGSRPWTNQVQLVLRFDGPKLRCEQVGREYSYTYSADEREQEGIRKQADSMGRERAVAAGLLKPFESHHTLVYDGAALLDYWETDGKPNGTTIDDPGKGTIAFLFDPRCLGLGTAVYTRSTVEGCLAYGEAKCIELVGEETVEGIPAWHVRVETKHGAFLDSWIEVAHPERVIKHACGANVAVSRYRGARSRDPLPSEVTVVTSANGSLQSRQRFVRADSQFNLWIEPTSFTLAGLGMQVGTAVTDVRIHRRLGYWTGVELSEDLPKRTESESQAAPSLTELLALVEADPASAEAFDAASWILLNTPDGPEVEKAAEAILKEHTRDTNLVHLCKELERLRHRCAKPILEAVLKENPSVDVRGTACFALATLYKDEAKYGENRQAKAEAEKRLERTITEFGQVEQWIPDIRCWGMNLADLARSELDEVQRLFIGNPAPPTEGQDLDGLPLRLTDYRGQVVVLVFWSDLFSEANEYGHLVEAMSGRPFALLGVNSDSDLTAAVASAKERQVTWPSFYDGRDGPISQLWKSRRWPDIWVLDRQGVIRYRDVRGRELRDAVTTLLSE